MFPDEPKLKVGDHVTVHNRVGYYLISGVQPAKEPGKSHKYTYTTLNGDKVPGAYYESVFSRIDPPMAPSKPKGLKS